MIILRVEGGLGNIMFEYAFAKRMAHINNAPLTYDIDSCKINPLGDYGLSLEAFAVNIANNLAPREKINYFKQFQKYPSKKAILHNLFLANEKKYVKEKQYRFDPAVLALRGDMYLHGWWQSEKYFADIRPTLLKDFTLRKPLTGKNEELAKEMTATNSVAIHIRRLDYVKNAQTRYYHGELTKKYYDRALSVITDQIKNPTLFVFSDDIPWVKENMKFPFNAIYIEGNLSAPHEDMTLMSLCKHTIVANSSFSWWGAWLNQNPNKIVVAPTPWVAAADWQDSTDVIPESWIALPADYIRS